MGGARVIYGSVWAKPTLWSWFVCYFTGINVVTWMVFIYDKRIAGGKDVVRVPENALFLLAVGAACQARCSRCRYCGTSGLRPHLSVSSLYGLVLCTEHSVACIGIGRRAERTGYVGGGHEAFHADGVEQPRWDARFLVR